MVFRSKPRSLLVSLSQSCHSASRKLTVCPLRAGKVESLFPCVVVKSEADRHWPVRRRSSSLALLEFTHCTFILSTQALQTSRSRAHFAMSQMFEHHGRRMCTSKAAAQKVDVDIHPRHPPGPQHKCQRTGGLIGRSPLKGWNQELIIICMCYFQAVVAHRI